MAKVKKEKKKKSALQIILTIVGILLAVCIVFVLGVRGYFRLPVEKYYQASEKGFVIPGLKDGFIPQGLSFDDNSGYFFVTGYDNDGDASPLYLVNKADGKLVKSLNLCDASGKAYTGHAGGLSVTDEYIYIAGGHDNCLYVYSYTDALYASDGASIGAIGSFDTGSLGVAFTTIFDNKLVAGEFYREVSYPTDDNHKMTTSGGDYNQALAAVYELDSSAPFGINPVPCAFITMPDLVQGMAVEDGKMVLSTSWGVSKSHFYTYDMNAVSRGTEFAIDGFTAPLWELDSASLVSTMEAAPMSEEIEFVDGKMYTMCESASNKYIFGKFTSGKYCYRTLMK